jgi:transposase
MAHGHSDEFKRDAARIALTSGLTRRQVSADLRARLIMQASGLTALPGIEIDR